MIRAAELDKITVSARQDVAKKFINAHPDVIDRIDSMLRQRGCATMLYYDNMGPMAVDASLLAVTLIEYGYGVRLSNPGSPSTSGLYIYWARDIYQHDSVSGIEWKARTEDTVPKRPRKTGKRE